MSYTWLFFVLGAVLSWGAYGPTLHIGQSGFADPAPLNKSLRALFCVGGAYFLVAVLVPGVLLGMKGELAGFTGKGAAFSTIAGVLGALGAVCITWAFKSGGSPFIVMPLVFAGAPVMNALISALSHPPQGGLRDVDVRLWIGLAMAAAGAFMVLKYKPA